MDRPRLLALGLAVLSPGAAFAQASGDAPPQAAAGYHDPTSPDIVVTAPLPRQRVNLLSGFSVLQGETLARELRSTIGETLQRQPGVSATSFGPSASRPVLRGFQGDRIRVLTDGIGSFDASTTSVDHAVAIDPLTAERVEVLRGPVALLYGSSAVGGVVNVIDRRIPRRVPDEPVHVEALATYASAADDRSGAAAVDVPVGTRVVLHADGSYLDSDQLRTGGYLLSRPLREAALASGDADVMALADRRGRLPNSQARTSQLSGGAAVLTDSGQLGFSVSRYDSRYGVPLRFSLEPGMAPEAPRIDVKQTRADARGEVGLGGSFLETLRVRLGAATYRHFELEPEGGVGTAFYSDGLEGRVELAQARRGPWTGAIGGQILVRDVRVEGEEAFLPPNETSGLGFFTLQELELGLLRMEAGARYERTEVSAAARNADRSFDALSASAGASYRLAPGWRVGMNLSRTARAPSAEELFSDGPHAGTQSFEIGSPDFDRETAWGLEAVLRGGAAGRSLELSAFHNWFSDYLYQDATGEVADGLPVYRWTQGDARYYGFEAQGTLTLARLGDVDLSADALADYVRATIEHVGPAPRIPPLRLLGGVEARSEQFQARAEVEWADDQRRTAENETETPGYTSVNLSIGVSPWGKGGPASLLLSASNIFDATVRRHASFLKDYAPLAGRDLRLSLRASF